MMVLSDCFLNIQESNEASFFIEQSTFFVKENDEEEIKVTFLAFKLHSIMKDKSIEEKIPILKDLFK